MFHFEELFNHDLVTLDPIIYVAQILTVNSHENKHHWG